MRKLLLSGALLLTLPVSFAQTASPIALQDSDRDGLSDALENSLLAQFAPRFMISRDDCSGQPAQFMPDTVAPVVLADDGTIYGQAFPRRNQPGQIELHYYHLWPRDCGEMGHALDAEHVSVLLQKEDRSEKEDRSPATWKATYWYAAAHEDTLCDASQVTRAKTLDAETHGARIWISAGKHASFLNHELCTYGCGGDQCRSMEPLSGNGVVDLGELKAPMNGSVWLASSQWPLTDKLGRTDFTQTRLERLDRMPEKDIAWANPAKRPAQAAILGANAGIGGAATGARATDTALAIADTHTGSALNQAADNTGSSLDKAAGNTGHALSTTFRDVGKALKKSTAKTGDALGH